MVEQDPEKNILLQAIRKRDPRDILSTLKIPTVDQHQEWIVNPLKRAKPPSEAEVEVRQVPPIQ